MPPKQLVLDVVMRWFVLGLCVLCVSCLYNDYRVGVGIADVTGPSAGVVLMGYVDPVLSLYILQSFFLSFFFSLFFFFFFLFLFPP
jgi:hypothetical protein